MVFWKTSNLPAPSPVFNNCTTRKQSPSFMRKSTAKSLLEIKNYFYHNDYKYNYIILIKRFWNQDAHIKCTIFTRVIVILNTFLLSLISSKLYVFWRILSVLKSLTMLVLCYFVTVMNGHASNQHAENWKIIEPQLLNNMWEKKRIVLRCILSNKLHGLVSILFITFYICR